MDREFGTFADDSSSSVPTASELGDTERVELGVSRRLVHAERTLPTEPGVVVFAMPRGIKPINRVVECDFDAIYTEAFAPTVEALDMRPERLDNLYGPQGVLDLIWRAIQRAEIVVVDFTNKDSTVTFEHGLAWTLGKRIIALTQHEDDIPSDVRGLDRYIRYSPHFADMGRMKRELTLQLEALREEPTQERAPTTWSAGPSAVAAPASVVAVNREYATVQTDDDRLGFLRSGDVEYTRFIADMSRLFKTGDRLDGAFLVDPERGEARYTLLAGQNNPWPVLASRYPAGTTFQGIVRRAVDGVGLFVGVDGGVNGLIPQSRITGPVPAEGARVEVTVTRMDSARRRIALRLAGTYSLPQHGDVGEVPDPEGDRPSVSGISGDPPPTAAGSDFPLPLPADLPEHYLVADMPAKVPVLADVSLLARITVKAPPWDQRASVPLKAFEPGPEGTPVTVIVQAPRELRPTEPLDQVIVVPPSGDSEPARFAFHAEQPGLFRLRVTAFAGGTFLGELTAEISVETNAQRTSRNTLIADLGPLRAEPGEVTLQVRFDGDRYTFQLLSDSYLFNPVLAEALTARPGEAVERALATLRAMADKRSEYTARNARTWMQETGIGLWNDMVPDLIKDQFWQLRPSIKAFSIACGHDTIPWELLHPLSQSGKDAGFLVEQFPVLRRVYDQRRSRHLSLGPAWYIVPPGSPANADQEVAALQHKLATATDTICDLEPLLALINAGDAGLLHFACHNLFKADQGGSSIAMGGGPFVPTLLNRAVTTRALTQRSPVVFINACRTAGAVPEYTQLLGWAGQFMAAGAGAFIGTLWAVPSDSARVFAEEFYESLTVGGTLGEATQAARQAIASNLADPTWLAYTIYGDPAATVMAI